MLNTKVTEAEKRDGKVYLKTEGAKGGQEATVRPLYAFASSANESHAYYRSMLTSCLSPLAVFL